MRLSQFKLLTKRNLTLERALQIAAAMEMTILESNGSKKAATSSHTKEKDINHIESQKYGIYCYFCEKKGHMAALCCFRSYIYTNVTSKPSTISLSTRSRLTVVNCEVKEEVPSDERT